jgi:uncharacterized RDD family membrane protein YckC
MFEPIDPRPASSPAAIAQRLDVAPHLFFRWLSTIIDYVSLTLFVVLLALIGKSAGLAGPGVAVGIAGVLLYFPITEGLWGRGLGKLITGLVVVDRDGRPPGLWKATVRTLLRLVEINPFLIGGIPAAIAVGVSQHHQRLGDMAADTFVIPKRALARVGPEDVFL